VTEPTPRPAAHVLLPLHPKKVLNSKWTAVKPQSKEKHFVVVSLVEPEVTGAPLVAVILEAVYSKRQQEVPWRSLQDATLWQQGWR
jgi:hypothetical protein